MADRQDVYRSYLAALKYERFVAETYESLVSKKLGRLFLHHAYPGKRSGHSHDIDGSIELTITGLSILILIECKHYKSRVGVSEVLEFAERISDIGAHKGVMVTTLGFQPGAYRIAAGRGIALVTTEPVWAVIQGITPYLGPPILTGLTIDAKNIPVAPDDYVGAAWELLLMFLADPDGSIGINKYVKRNGYWKLNEHGEKRLDRERVEN